MFELLIGWLILAVAIFLAAKLLPGIEVKSFGQAIVAALVLGLVNALIRPVVAFFSLPLIWITLGLFYLLINGLMLMLVGAITPGLKVQGCLWAVLGSILISAFRGILDYLIF